LTPWGGKNGKNPRIGLFTKKPERTEFVFLGKCNLGLPGSKRVTGQGAGKDRGQKEKQKDTRVLKVRRP